MDLQEIYEKYDERVDELRQMLGESDEYDRLLYEQIEVLTEVLEDIKEILLNEGYDF